MTNYHCSKCNRVFATGKAKGRIKYECKYCQMTSHFENGQLVENHIVQQSWDPIIYEHRCVGITNSGRECDRIIIATDGNAKIMKSCPFCGHDNKIETKKVLEEDQGYNFTNKGSLFGSKKVTVV